MKTPKQLGREASAKMKVAHRAGWRSMISGKRTDSGIVLKTGAGHARIWMRGTDESREETAVYGTCDSVNKRGWVGKDASGALRVMEWDDDANAATFGDAAQVAPPVDATRVRYTPADATDYGTTPTTAQGALDDLAANKADTSLDNLASVEINTSLISDTDNTDDLGSSLKKWREVFTNALTLEERSAPATPASGDLTLYAKTDGKVYAKNDAGTEYDLTAAVAGSVPAATTSVIGGLLLDETPLSGNPIALTLVRLGMMLGVAMLGGDRRVPSFELPTNPVVSASETSRWTRYASNPILTPTQAWENDCLNEPTVRYEDGLWKMWYSGGWTTQSIGYATSVDGYTWTKYAGNPVIGSGGSGISGYAGGSHVFKHGDLYYAYWYDASGGNNIKVATSTDGIAWTAQGTALAAGAGSLGTGFANTHVWVENGNQWKMLMDYRDGSVWKTGLATSTDGLTFTPDTVNSPLTDLQVGTGTYGAPWMATPQKHDNLYHLWYLVSSTGTLPTNIVRASSPDLINWTQYASNPILEPDGGTFEFDQVGDPNVIEVNGKSYLFYCGMDNPNEFGRIGLLTFDGPLAALVSETGVAAYLDANDKIPEAHLPLATSSAFGAVKPDNVTITVAAGVLSAAAPGIYAPVSTGDPLDPLILDSDGRIIVGRIA